MLAITLETGVLKVTASTLIAFMVFIAKALRDCHQPVGFA